MTALAGLASTETRLEVQGRWAAVVCGSLDAPPEFAMIDVTTGAIAVSHTLAASGPMRNPMLVDRDELVVMTSGGRVEWIPTASA